MKMAMGAIKQVENFNRKLDEKNDRNRIDHYERLELSQEAFNKICDEVINEREKGEEQC